MRTSAPGVVNQESATVKSSVGRGHVVVAQFVERSLTTSSHRRNFIHLATINCIEKAKIKIGTQCDQIDQFVIILVTLKASVEYNYRIINYAIFCKSPNNDLIKDIPLVNSGLLLACL